jgi:hypothetical protein
MDQDDAVSKAFKANPSLENYLALRRANPDAQIEVAVFGGIDSLFAMEEELKAFGIAAHPLMTGVLDADQEAISDLSLILIERIVSARRLAAQGETHLIRRGLAMPDSLIDWLINVMLDAQSWNNTLDLNRDLIVLIRERLGGATQHYQQVAEVYHKRRSAVWIGAQLKARGVDPTLRVLADYLKVAPSTIARWFPDDDLGDQIDLFAVGFDADGKLDINRAVGPLRAK